MKRAALALVLIAGFAVPFVHAQPPRWTKQGVVTKLNKRLVTVADHTCRIASKTLGYHVAQVYRVGDAVKIRCAHHVLEEIATKALPSVTATGSRSSGPTFSVSGSDIVITGLDASTITVNTPIGGTTYVCTIAVGSPSVAGLRAGDRLRDVGCSNGTLTELTRLPG